jgi:ferredoxin
MNTKKIFLQNTDGLFFVDDACIACDACTIEAPRFFSMNFEEGHAYVSKQPKTPQELEECENALSACPVEAIGKRVI